MSRYKSIGIFLILLTSTISCGGNKELTGSKSESIKNNQLQVTPILNSSSPPPISAYSSSSFSHVTSTSHSTTSTSTPAVTHSSSMPAFISVSASKIYSSPPLTPPSTPLSTDVSTPLTIFSDETSLHQQPDTLLSNNFAAEITTETPFHHITEYTPVTPIRFDDICKKLEEQNLNFIPPSPDTLTKTSIGNNANLHLDTELLSALNKLHLENTDSTENMGGAHSPLPSSPLIQGSLSSSFTMKKSFRQNDSATSIPITPPPAIGLKALLQRTEITEYTTNSPIQMESITMQYASPQADLPDHS